MSLLVAVRELWWMSQEKLELIWGTCNRPVMVAVHGKSYAILHRNSNSNSESLSCVCLESYDFIPKFVQCNERLCVTRFGRLWSWLNLRLYPWWEWKQLSKVSDSEGKASRTKTMYCDYYFNFACDIPILHIARFFQYVIYNYFTVQKTYYKVKRQICLS
jgi:hypothetical protein